MLFAVVLFVSSVVAHAKVSNDDPAKDCQDFISSFSAVTKQLSATKNPTPDEIRNIFSSYPNEKIKKFLDVYLIPKVGKSNELNAYIEKGTALQQCQSMLRGY